MRGLAVAAVLALAASGAKGHPMPNSTVVVQAAPGAVELVVSTPLSELSAAMGGSSAREAAVRYLIQHAGVMGDDGRAWEVEVRDVRDSHAALAATLTFTPAAGGSARASSLCYDAVTHRVASHYVLVYRRDGHALVPLGRLQSPTTTLRLP